MKAVDHYIPMSIQLIEEQLANDGKVAKEYKGYIAAIGASIMQSGILATFAFYSSTDQQSNSTQNKVPILTILHQLLQPTYQVDSNTEITGILQYAAYLQKNNQRNLLRRLKQDVINAAIALKLALRTFELEEPKNVTND